MVPRTTTSPRFGRKCGGSEDRGHGRRAELRAAVMRHRPPRGRGPPSPPWQEALRCPLACFPWSALVTCCLHGNLALYSTLRSILLFRRSTEAALQFGRIGNGRISVQNVSALSEVSYVTDFLWLGACFSFIWIFLSSHFWLNQLILIFSFPQLVHDGSNS